MKTPNDDYTEAQDIGPLQTKPQMLSPGWQQFRRVQTVLESDEALRRKLSAKTHATKNRAGKTLVFSPEAVDIARAFFDEGKDAAKLRVLEILEMAGKRMVRSTLRGVIDGAEGLPPRLPEPLPKPVKGNASSPRAETPNPAPNHASELAGSASTGLISAEILVPEAPIVLPATLEDFSIEIHQRVKSQCQKFVAQTIAIGEAFLKAVDKYGKSIEDLAAKSELAYNTVTLYVRVAKKFGPASWARAQLPASIDSLVRLSRLKEDQLRDAISKGKVRPDIGRKEVKAVLQEYRPAASAKHASSKSNPTTALLVHDLKELNQLVGRFQETIEACLTRFPNSREDFIYMLEGHAGWLKGTVAKFRSDSARRNRHAIR